MHEYERLEKCAFFLQQTDANQVHKIELAKDSEELLHKNITGSDNTRVIL